jgi:hypothetical protein
MFLLEKVEALIKVDRGMSMPVVVCCDGADESAGLLISTRKTRRARVKTSASVKAKLLL